MASDNEYVIRCKTENGSFILENVSNDTTLNELKIHLGSRLDIEPESLKILCGYPPRALPDVTKDMKLEDVNIQSGEIIIVQKKSPAERAAASSDEKSTASGGALQDAAQSKFTPAVEDPTLTGEIELPYEVSTGGIMMRYVVPSNNSCLFTSVYFVLSNGDLNIEKSTELRRIIARVVSSNPQRFTSAYLGMTNKEYCAWIQNTDHWGGAIELAILSEHFRIEIVAVDTKSLNLLRFGENKNYNNRIFLIYDGIHYDPLILELENAPMQTIFPVADDRPMDMALEIAREAQSSKQYTDLKNFTLKCGQCQLKFRGDREAREHALKTGHVEFGEVLA